MLYLKVVKNVNPISSKGNIYIYYFCNFLCIWDDGCSLSLLSFFFFKFKKSCTETRGLRFPREVPLAGLSPSSPTVRKPQSGWVSEGVGEPALRNSLAAWLLIFWVSNFPPARSPAPAAQAPPRGLRACVLRELGPTPSFPAVTCSKGRLFPTPRVDKRSLFNLLETLS